MKGGAGSLEEDRSYSLLSLMQDRLQSRPPLEEAPEMAPSEQDPPYVKPLHLLQHPLCCLSGHCSLSSTLREHSQEAYH